ncbi:MAG: type II toxin-antitoxin system prevent-host-death family antitoxin [Actinobacteria bacterium]|nr:type II toxin-antitoxin system prevent-host-death family antitoxin [Actinomycetota bacterium]
MKMVTAKQLKNKTGEVLDLVAREDKVLVTKRGKPFAVMTRFDGKRDEDALELRPFDEAWKDIMETLERSEPYFEDWRKAIAWSRRRI